MKTMLTVATLCSAGLLLADLAPHYTEPTVQDVAEGASEAAITTTFGDRSSFYKTGPGTLTVPGGSLSRSTDGTLSVLQGKVTVTASDKPTIEPPAICQKAAFWVNETSVVTSNGVVAAGETAPVYAAKWCDVRESDTTSPTLISALPKWCGSATSKPAATKLGLPPVVTTYAGRPGVYFGGATSGQYLRWKQNGKETTVSSVRHIFVVHAISNTVGHVVGYESSGRWGPYLTTVGSTIPSFDSNTSMFANRGDVCAPQFSARFFLDGVQTDLRTQPPKSGWQLLEGDYIDVLTGADNFGRSGFTETLKGSQGADYIGEALIFTNQLQETERVALERYLMEKWNLPQLGGAISNGPQPRQNATTLALANGATATIEAAADTVTPPLAFAGDGDAEKTGEGVMAIGPSVGLDWSGAFTWTAGSLRLQGGRFPALTVSGGERFDFSSYKSASGTSPTGDDAGGLTCTKWTDGKREEVATAGDGWLRVHTVAPGVKRLKVSAVDADIGSVLQLEGRVQKVAQAPTAGSVWATIPNADFEEPIQINETNFDRESISSDNTKHGWTARSGSFYIMCVQNPASKNTWSQWLNSGAKMPRGGTNILQLVQKKTVSTTVTVPEPGIYELSFDARSRYTYTTGGLNGGYPFANQQPLIEILFGKTWTEVERVGTLPLGSQQFCRYHYRFSVASAGTWELGISSVDSGKDCCSFFDNFRMVRVAEPETEETVQIPNGNLDRLTRPAADGNWVHGRFTRENVPENWSFSWLPTCPFASVVTNGSLGAVFSGGAVKKSDLMQLFPFNEEARGGAALGLVSTGAFAKVTFTVPAGTWRLRGLVQRCPTYMDMSPIHKDIDMGGKPSIRASLMRANDENVDLGTVAVANRSLVKAYWPTAFTVAEGSEQVTLTIEQTVYRGFAIVDDFILVRESSANLGNLLANANFEQTSNNPWQNYRVPDIETKYRGSGLRLYSDRPIHWGYSAFEGRYRLAIQNGSGSYQDITVPQTGLHRFTMHLRSRPFAYYAGNPIRVWMAKGGVTNVLATVPTLSTRHWVEASFVIDVKEAGAWRFGIEGRCGKMDDPATGYEADHDTMIDGVSFTRCRDEINEAPTLPENLKIVVEKGAKLLLDYTGSAKCGPVVYAGKPYYGTINAKTHPEFVTGVGTLEANPGGMMILIR